MSTLAKKNTQIPRLRFECTAVASPCKCIVALSDTRIPSLELSLNTQLLNVQDVKLPSTKAPTLLLANSQRVATAVVAEVDLGI